VKMGILIFLIFFMAIFLVVAFLAFILRDKSGKRGYEQPPSCPKCRKSLEGE